jgi:hypothetical protein
MLDKLLNLGDILFLTFQIEFQDTASAETILLLTESLDRYELQAKWANFLKAEQSNPDLCLYTKSIFDPLQEACERAFSEWLENSELQEEFGLSKEYLEAVAAFGISPQYNNYTSDIISNIQPVPPSKASVSVLTSPPLVIPKAANSNLPHPNPNPIVPNPSATSSANSSGPGEEGETHAAVCRIGGLLCLFFNLHLFLLNLYLIVFDLFFSSSFPFSRSGSGAL